MSDEKLEHKNPGEDRFRVLFNTTTASILLVNEKGRFVEMNDAAVRFFGYSRNEMLKLSFQDVTHPDDLAKSTSTRTRLTDRREERDAVLEKRYVTRDGAVRWAQVQIAVAPETEWDRYRFITIIHDTSPQKALEEELRESEQQYRALFDSMVDAVIVAAVDTGEILACNPAVETLTGYRVDELINRPQRILHPPEHTTPDGRSVDFRRQLMNPSGEPVLSEIVRKDGESRSVSIQATRFEFRGRDALQGVFRDITEQRRKEEAQRAHEALYRRIFNTAPIGILHISSDGSISSVNQAAVEALGSPSIEATMQINVFTLPQLKSTGISESVQTVFETGQTVREELEYTSKWGKTSYFRVNYGPITDDKGQVTSVQLMMEDISEAREAQQERITLERKMQDAQRYESLSLLAGGIAHDFNNYLTTILGNASLVLMDMNESAPMHEALTDVVEAAERAGDLTTQMLAYSGRGRFTSSMINLTTLIQDSQGLIKTLVDRNRAIRYELADDLPSLMGDRTQIRQLLVNLVTNAAEAMADKDTGEIVIRTGRMTHHSEPVDGFFVGDNPQLGEYLYFEVEDQGVGIAEDGLQRIFDPFYSTKFTGRGLGLAAARGIAQGHQGFILVESILNKGSLFRAAFPIADSTPAVEPSKPREDSFPAGKGTILVAEDEPTVLRMAVRVLERAGYTVLQAADGQQALDIYKGHLNVVDVLLVDLTLPTLSGDEVIEQARKLNPDVRTIIISGFSLTEAEKQFASLGVDTFLQKPFHPNELARTITWILKQKS